jgi:hypothetical protein
MPKYLIQASYTTEGIQGLVRDSASGRRADVQSAVKALGAVRVRTTPLLTVEEVDKALEVQMHYRAPGK